MRNLSKYLGICCSQVHQIFSKRLGTDWEIKFRSSRWNIDETIPIKIPPLIVREEIINRVKARLEANNTSKHGQLKNKYLLGRMIFCRQCGYALVGAEFHGHLYYRHRHQADRRCSAFGSIRADIIDNPVFNDIFEVVGDVTRIRESIEKDLPDLEKQKLLSKQLDLCRGDLLKLDAQQRRLIDSIANGIIENEEASEKISEIREKDLILKQTMNKIKVQLDSMRLKNTLICRLNFCKDNGNHSGKVLGIEKRWPLKISERFCRNCFPKEHPMADVQVFTLNMINTIRKVSGIIKLKGIFLI